MLRMEPRSTVATCTDNGARLREKIGMRTTAAMTPAASHVVRRRRRAGCPFEL